MNFWLPKFKNNLVLSAFIFQLILSINLGYKVTVPIETKRTTSKLLHFPPKHSTSTETDLAAETRS